MAFPVVASHAETSITTPATSFAVTLPSGIASGDRLVIVIGGGRQDASDFAATGWTSLIQQLAPSSNGIGAVFYRAADGSEGSTATVTRATPGECPGAIALRITGHDSETPPEAAAFRDPAIQPESDPPSLGPSWGSADTLWIAATYHNAGTAISAWPTSYADNQLVSGGVGSGAAGVAVATHELAASSDDPAAFSWGNSNRGAAFTIAIKPGGGAGGVAATPVAVAASASAVPLVATFGGVPGPRAASTFARPDASVNPFGAWVMVGAASAHAAVNEVTASDAEYAYHGLGTPTNLILQFPDLSALPTDRPWVLRMRVAPQDGAGTLRGGDGSGVSFSLGDGSIGFGPAYDLALWAVWTDVSVTLSQTEVDGLSTAVDPNLFVSPLIGHSGNYPAVSYVALEILGEVAATPVLVPVGASCTVVPLIATFGAAPVAAAPVPIAASAVVVPLTASFGVIAARPVPLAAAVVVAPVTAALGSLAGALVPGGARASVAPLTATLGAIAAAPVAVAASAGVAPLAGSLGEPPTVAATLVPVAASAATVPLTATLDALSTDLAPAAVSATVTPLTATLGGVAGDLVPARAGAVVAPLTASFGVIAASVVPVGGSASVVPLAALRPEPGEFALVPVAASVTAVPLTATLGPVAATLDAVGGAVVASPLTGTLGSVAGSLVPVAASVVVAPLSATSDAGTIAATPVPVVAGASVAPLIATLGPISASLVALELAVVDAPLTASLGTISADLVPIAGTVTVSPLLSFPPVAGVLVPVGASCTVVPLIATFASAAVRASRWTLASGPPVSAVVASGPPVTATLASGPPVSARLS